MVRERDGHSVQRAIHHELANPMCSVSRADARIFAEGVVREPEVKQKVAHACLLLGCREGVLMPMIIVT